MVLTAQQCVPQRAWYDAPVLCGFTACELVKCKCATAWWVHVCYGAVRVQMNMIETITMEGQPSSSTLAQYVEDTYGYEYDFRWLALAITAAIAALIRVLVCIAAVWRHGW